MEQYKEISNKSKWCFLLKESITLKLELNRVHMFCAPNSQLSQLQYFLLCLVTEPPVRRSLLPSLLHLFQQFFLKHRHTRISAHIHAFLKHTHKNSNTQSQTLRQTQVHTHERTTALSPWLGQAICLSPPSPVTAAVCPGWFWASQKSPSVIQQHINLLKSQPFQKGRCQSNFRSVVQGNIISLSQIHDSGTSALDDMKSEGGACAFSPCVLLLLSTYLISLGAFSKSHSLSLSIPSYLYEHTGLWECTVSGAAARSGPEERLEQYRLMAQETASASGMNK